MPRLITVLMIVLFAQGCSSLERSLVRNNFVDPGGGHQQILVVRKSRPHVFSAQVFAWEQFQGKWRPIFKAMPAVVGRKGIALPGAKREGDGRTPSGAFDLQQAFGYGPALTTGLNYRKVGEEDIWVDDPGSPQYNQWVKLPTEAGSFEHMKREDQLYEMGAVIEYNTDPVVPGNGSAIFLHIWRGPNSPTAGCVALSKSNVRKMLKWLDADKNPVITIEAPAQSEGR